MGPKKQEKINHHRTGDKYGKILEAALKVFARKGFYQSKVSEVAREARVADGTIYLYFRNKDDILISLFEVEMQKVLDTMSEALSRTDDPVEKIKIFAQTHLNLVQSRPEAASILQVEVRQSSRFMKEYKNEKFVQYLNLIENIIVEAQKAGRVRPEVRPDVAKRAFFGALDEMARHWVLSTRRRYGLEAAAQQISDLFILGLTQETKPVSAAR